MKERNPRTSAANNTRKPLWGYKSRVFAALVLGFLSFLVWAHHLWLTGMGSVVWKNALTTEPIPVSHM